MYQFLHMADSLRLVVLNADHALGLRKQLQDHLQALHHLLAFLQHHPIVGGEIRLTFRSVDNDKVNLVRFLGRQLHMGGKARSSQARDARLLDNLQNLFGRQRGRIPLLSHACYGPVLAVIFHDHALHHVSAGGTALLDALDRAGHRTDDIGRNETAGFPDLLSHQHRIAFLDQRHRRGPDMLGHGKYQIALWQQLLNRLVFRQLFSFIGMNAALKCSQSHLTNPLSSFFVFRQFNVPQALPVC